MNIFFKYELNCMTFECHILQPKPMLKWVVNKKLCQNPNVVTTFDEGVLTPCFIKFWYKEV